MKGKIQGCLKKGLKEIPANPSCFVINKEQMLSSKNKKLNSLFPSVYFLIHALVKQSHPILKMFL